jgi:hypothetical protein
LLLDAIECDVVAPWYARRDAGVDQVRPSEQIDEAVAGGKIDPHPQFRVGHNKVRKSKSGIALREAMRNLGAEPTFFTATNAWRAVADDLSHELSRTNTKEFALQTVAIKTGKGIIVGVLGSDAVVTALHGTGHLSSQMELVLGGFAGSMIEIIGSFYTMAKGELERQRIGERLGNAVRFSCVSHPTIGAERDRTT